ncbi:MAG: choice-of-anchor D domain-containing protein [Gammaproteobacteria bacterium]
MKKPISVQWAGVLALLYSSLGLGATVTLTPSNPNPNVGDTFSVVVTGAGFPETAGATLLLDFDPAVVSINTPTLSNGILLAAGSPFTGGVIADSPFVAGGQLTFLAGNPPAALPVGDFTSIEIFFTALAAGPANIVLIDDGVDNVWTDANTFEPIPVTYTQASVTVLATTEPNAAVTDSVAPVDDLEVPFGDITQGQTGTQTVTVTNSGTADLVLGTIAAPASPFSIANDLCSGQTLTPSTPCTFDVLFQPVANGLASDTLDVLSNDPDTATVTVNLNGTGTPAPGPNVAVTDSVVPADDLTVPFGDVTQGQTSTQTVTVSNSGNAALLVGAIASANPLAAPFTIANDNCSSQSVPALASCTFQVQFAPAAVGLVSDTLDIPSDDPDTATVTVTVNGTGTPIPAPNVAVTDSVAPNSDLSVPFGTITVGGSSTQTVTVTNSGNAALLVGAVASANPLAAPFTIANDTCSNQSIAALATCSFQVQFAPVAAGVVNDALDIPSNDADTPSVTVAVSGTGTVSMGPAISVTDAVSPTDDRAIDFGDVFLTNTVDQTVTVTNDGSGDLVLGTVGTANPLAAPFSILPIADTCSGVTLAPAESCTILVEYAADLPDVYNDSFDIPSNDPDEPSVTVSVTATGQQISKGGSSAFDPWSLALLAGLPLIRRRRR